MQLGRPPSTRRGTGLNFDSLVTYLRHNTRTERRIPFYCKAESDGARRKITVSHRGIAVSRSRKMDWDVIASSRLDDLTKPKSTGRPTNTHVVQSRPESKPDFERMRDLVHQKEPAPAGKKAA